VKVNTPKIIAHRGVPAYAPENTLPSFQKALDMGADGLELDVHLCKDGHLVVIHDEKVERTSNGRGSVKDLTLPELKQLDFGAWFHRDFAGVTIPTLEEVLDFLKGWHGLINIEIKSGPTPCPGIEERLVSLLKGFRLESEVIVSSFNHHCLKNIKQIAPTIHTGLLYTARLVEPWHYARSMHAAAIHPFFRNVTPELVRRCKQEGIVINPFTVDSEEDMASILAAGVDGLITNRSDVALRVRQSLCLTCTETNAEERED